jgi:DnaJ-class molecular chaperone
MIGLAGSLCPFCGGSCVVTRERAEEFDEDNLAEKECPHCAGKGIRGLAGDLCSYCKGDTFVSEEKLDAYDPDKIDEAECPHCGGAGTTGLAGNYCVYCRGSQFVTREKRKTRTRRGSSSSRIARRSGTAPRSPGSVLVWLPNSVASRFCRPSCRDSTVNIFMRQRPRALVAEVASQRGDKFNCRSSGI